MSAKQFITAEEHLAKLEITMQQASDFIDANINQPDLMFSTARDFGVTINMLSEIADFTVSDIGEYFASNGHDSIELSYTSILINSDLGTLETLVSFNTNSGILSNAALSDVVGPLLNEPLTLPFTFRSIYDFAPEDEIYDAEELGVGHLNNVLATDENIESLFYGTLINIFTALDETELNQINVFPKDEKPEDFQALLFEVLSESPPTVARTDEELANLVTEEGIEIINKFWSGESELVGVLDHSFLGLATA